MRALLLSVLVLSACSEHSIRSVDTENDGDDPVLVEPAEPNEPEEADEPEEPPASAPGEPVADAGADTDAVPLDRVTLDGLASYDPEGNAIVAYDWAVVAAPDGSSTLLDDDTNARPSFFADLAGTYTFELTVQNDKGVWDATPDAVTVTVTPLQGFYVELSWDTAADLDLHLLDGSTGLFADGDCNYCNMTPDWGGPGAADNPSLDWDSTDGSGPETITIDTPADGTYDVRVHYFGSGACGGSCGATTATVRVYLDGVLHEEFITVVDPDLNIWQPATIDWPTGLVTEIDALTSTNQSWCN